MKKLILLTLFGCIALCSHAWLGTPYDRNFNPRSSEFTPCTVIPADSTLTTVFDGIEMSAMDYAEIYITVAPDTNFYTQAFAHIIGYGPSPRLKSLDKNSTARQKLIIADNAFYEYRKYGGRLDGNPAFDDAYEYDYADRRIEPRREDGRHISNIDAIADFTTFDFDLSEYACDFDIYFLLLGTDVIFDNAFRNFKFSDNIKTVNIFLCVREIGHDAFTSIRNIETVDVRLMTNWAWDYEHCGTYLWSEFSESIHMYSDSFTQEAYNEALVRTFASESAIYNLQTNPPARYSNNIYRFFKKWHTGVENVAIDVATPQITLDSNILTIQGAESGQIIEIFNVEGRKIGQFETNNEGAASYTISHSGVILVKVGQTVSKFILKS